MIDTVDGNIFAHLILIFTITINDILYPIALIHPYDNAIVGARLQKDRDLGFLWVRAKPRSAAEFISARSIICSALLAPAFDKDNDFLVMDLIDPDLFLRVLELRRPY